MQNWWRCFRDGRMERLGFSRHNHGQRGPSSGSSRGTPVRAAETAHTNRPAPTIPPGQRSPSAERPRRHLAGSHVEFEPSPARQFHFRDEPQVSVRLDRFHPPAVHHVAGQQPLGVPPTPPHADSAQPANPASRAIAQGRCQNTSRLTTNAFNRPRRLPRRRGHRDGARVHEAVAKTDAAPLALRTRPALSASDQRVCAKSLVLVAQGGWRWPRECPSGGWERLPAPRRPAPPSRGGCCQSGCGRCARKAASPGQATDSTASASARARESSSVASPAGGHIRA